MAWIFLTLAGALEVAFTTSLKYSEGLTKTWPTVLFIATTIGSFTFLAQAIKTIPLGTAYAVWTGIGAVGTVIVGIAVFGEPATASRLAFLALIVGGIIGLKLVSA